MSGYEAEITATFTDPRVAGRFAVKCEAEGLSPERDGATVTVEVWHHGDETVVLELAKRLNGQREVEVLSDYE